MLRIGSAAGAMPSPLGKVPSIARRMRAVCTSFRTIYGVVVRCHLIRQPFGLPPPPKGKALVRCSLAALNDNCGYPF